MSDDEYPLDPILAELDYIYAPTLYGPSYIAHIAYNITPPHEEEIVLNSGERKLLSYLGHAETLCRDRMQVSSIVPFSDDWANHWDSPLWNPPRICGKCLNAAGNLHDVDPELIRLDDRGRIERMRARR